MVKALRTRLSRAVNGRFPRLSWDLWSAGRTLRTMSPADIPPALANQWHRRRRSAPRVLRPTRLLIVVPSDDHERLTWGPAEGNYSYELTETAAAYLGAARVTTIRISRDESTEAFHERVTAMAQSEGATHILARIDVEANAGQHWSWDHFTKLLRRRWDGVFLPLSYDSAYPYVSMHLDRIGRLDHRAVPVVLDRPIEGVVRPKRPAAGPLFLPLSDRSMAVIDEALSGITPDIDLSFIGNVAGYPYRATLLENLASAGLEVTVNPQGRDANRVPGFIDYATALARSRVTLNFTRCNGVPVTQLKTRMLEGSLFGSVVAADSSLYARDYFSVGEEFIAYDSPRDLQRQLEALDDERLTRMRTSARARADVLRVRNFWEQIDRALLRRGFPSLDIAARQ